MNRRIAFVVAINTLGLLACCCCMPPAPVQPKQVAVGQEKQINFNDPRDLYSKFLGAGNKAGVPHKGQSVELIGTVHSTHFSVHKDLWFMLSTDNPKLVVMVTFDASRKDEILGLKKGSSVKTKGTINQIVGHEGDKVVSIDLDGIEVVPHDPDEDDARQNPVDREFKEVPDTDFKTSKAGDYQTPICLATGQTVYVRGYVRRDGTYVAPHTRNTPGSGTSKSGGRKK